MYSPSMFNTATAHNIFCSIGFNSDRIKVVEIKWRDDEAGSKGGRNFNLLSNGGIQFTYCLPHKLLLLDLAKISITPTEVQFYTDEVTAFQANDGEVYVAANKVLRNIGFNEERVKAIRIKWRDDEVVSSKGRYFNLRYSSGIQPVDKDTYCLSTKILPLALAKISITPAFLAMGSGRG